MKLTKISTRRKGSAPPDAYDAVVRKHEITKADFGFSFDSDSRVGHSFLSPISPNYNPEIMRKAVLGNNTLLQCLAAIVTNCALAGHELTYIGKEKKDKESPESLNEFNRIKGFVDSPDGKSSIREIKEKRLWDSLIYGYSFIEIGRDINGSISWYRWLCAKTTYLCGLDPSYVETDRLVYRNGLLTDLRTKEKFRRYVRQNGSTKTYYKEFGDPRTVDPGTGLVASIALKNAATELIHIPNLPLSLYGNTEWENNLPSVLGSKEAEIVNLEFFREGGLPAIVVLVSGGVLTDEAANDIEDKFNTGKAKDKMHKAMIIEARGDANAAGGIDGSIPAPKLEIKELGATRSDGLFQEYDRNCALKVRSSLRLPAIFIGETDSYNYATARASLETTENQVFSPKRQTFDDIMNNKILALEGVPSATWKFVSTGTKISDPEGVIAALEALTAAGAITPNGAALIYNALFGANIAERDEEWANTPIRLVELMLTPDNGAEVLGEGVKASITTLKDSFGVKKPAPPIKMLPAATKKPAPKVALKKVK